jgi:hypothetical protein
MLQSIQRMMKKSPFWGRFLVLLPPFYIVDLIVYRNHWLRSEDRPSALLGILLVSVISALFFSFIAYVFNRPDSQSGGR